MTANNDIKHINMEKLNLRLRKPDTSGNRGHHLERPGPACPAGDEVCGSRREVPQHHPRHQGQPGSRRKKPDGNDAPGSYPRHSSQIGGRWRRCPRGRRGPGWPGERQVRRRLARRPARETPAGPRLGESEIRGLEGSVRSGSVDSMTPAAVHGPPSLRRPGNAHIRGVTCR